LDEKVSANDKNSYRLSILGFIGSEELAAEYGKGNIGNQGKNYVLAQVIGS
jgi:hypothetical protein